MDYSEDSVMIRWVRTLKRENTKRNYVNNLLVYCRFLNLSPTQLRDEARTEQVNNVFKGDRKIKEHFEDFKYFLDEQKLSTNTIHSYFNGIKSFYKYNELETSNIDLESVTCKRGNDEIPTKDEIQQILNVSDVLEKALILTGVSSGLAANEIINLKICDLTFDEVTNVTTLKVHRVKTKVSYYTFLSPEATLSVKEYIKYRSRTSEDKKKNKAMLKQKINSDTDYLFCIRNVPDKYQDTQDDELRKFAVTGLMSIYRDLSEKVGKSTGKGEFNKIRSHTMRKYFDSALLNAGCDFFHVEYFMGHKLPATQSHYFTVNVDKLKEMYMKFIPFLTIQKELDVSVSPEYLQIKKENEILRAETERHIVERSELQELRNEIDTLYQEIRDTPEGFKLGARLVRKIHPNRLLLLPDNGNDEDIPDDM